MRPLSAIVEANSHAVDEFYEVFRDRLNGAFRSTLEQSIIGSSEETSVRMRSVGNLEQLKLANMQRNTGDYARNLHRLIGEKEPSIVSGKNVTFSGLTPSSAAQALDRLFRKQEMVREFREGSRAVVSDSNVLNKPEMSADHGRSVASSATPVEDPTPDLTAVETRGGTDFLNEDVVHVDQILHPQSTESDDLWQVLLSSILSMVNASPEISFVRDDLRQQPPSSEPGQIGIPIEPRYPDGVSMDLGQGIYRTEFADGSVIVDYPVGHPENMNHVLHRGFDGPDEDANMFTVYPDRTEIIFNRPTQIPGGYLFEPGDLATIDNFGNIYAGRAPDFDLSGAGRILLEVGAPGLGRTLGRLWRAGKAFSGIEIPAESDTDPALSPPPPGAGSDPHAGFPPRYPAAPLPASKRPPAVLPANVPRRIVDGYDPYGGISESEFASRYYDPTTGWWRYPDNDGIALDAAGRKLIIDEDFDAPDGFKFDRFGNSRGAYLADEGEPYANRALPPDSLASGYYVYERVPGASLPTGWRIQKSVIAPGFGQWGGGIQYRILDENGKNGRVQDLLDAGYLREVA
ncbi:glycohydrolase toxin TNT-related protein [Nocardia otitidiscaviarum]|uniref:glycohydrolase toxin TNT-related protein n=1 Tax=Nocardia otitidiscaviarum TaxID=1823 RepID=UPI00245758E1|nr:glycohydrolase toxin TNT-related protein [Nocardia otitidiscaviarum]